MKTTEVKLILATILIISGLILLFLGFYQKPVGEIDNSVLVAFGETSTFAGSLFGIQSLEKYKFTKKLQENERKNVDN